ncbi:MAG: retroviral-like aspartic protease family protein [Gammaproteobacteria bacterium]
MRRVIAFVVLSLASGHLLAESLLSFSAKIPIHDRGAVTYYVHARVGGREDTEFMVDTGSGYTAINERMLAEIASYERPEYIRSIAGVLADGTEISMPIYRISSLNIGGQCLIQNVEVAVLPGETRNILGLSALKMVAPFSLYVDPPALLLSNCGPDGERLSELEASL